MESKKGYWIHVPAVEIVSVVVIVKLVATVKIRELCYSVNCMHLVCVHYVCVFLNKDHFYLFHNSTCNYQLI